MEKIKIGYYYEQFALVKYIEDEGNGIWDPEILGSVPTVAVMDKDGEYSTMGSEELNTITNAISEHCDFYVEDGFMFVFDNPDNELLKENKPIIEIVYEKFKDNGLLDKYEFVFVDELNEVVDQYTKHPLGYDPEFFKVYLHDDYFGISFIEDEKGSIDHNILSSETLSKSIKKILYAEDSNTIKWIPSVTYRGYDEVMVFMVNSEINRNDVAAVASLYNALESSIQYGGNNKKLDRFMEWFKSWVIYVPEVSYTQDEEDAEYYSLSNIDPAVELDLNELN